MIAFHNAGRGAGDLGTTPHGGGGGYRENAAVPFSHVLDGLGNTYISLATDLSGGMEAMLELCCLMADDDSNDIRIRRAM